MRFPGETDGTGHIAVSWQNAFQPHDSRYKFIDPSNGKVVGSYLAAGMYPLIGQASGFMGGECAGSMCQEDYVVLDPAGKELYKSPSGGTGNNVNVNDPTGGMIHVRFSESSAGTIMLLDAIDAAGNIRWTRALPDVFGKGDSRAMRVGGDRQGNVLGSLVERAPLRHERLGGSMVRPLGHAGGGLPCCDRLPRRVLRARGQRPVPGQLQRSELAGVLPVVPRERESDEVVRAGSIGDENVSGPRRDPGRAPTLLL